MWKAILSSWLFALGEYCLQVTILTSFDAVARVRALLVSKLCTSGEQEWPHSNPYKCFFAINRQTSQISH